MNIGFQGRDLFNLNRSKLYFSFFEALVLKFIGVTGESSSFSWIYSGPCIASWHPATRCLHISTTWKLLSTVKVAACCSLSLLLHIMLYGGTLGMNFPIVNADFGGLAYAGKDSSCAKKGVAR